MFVITSADNKTVKHVNRLLQKKYRDEYGEFIVEGYKNVLDSYTASSGLVCVCLSESAYGKYGADFPPESITVISDNVFDKMGDTKHGQGVIGVFKIPEPALPAADRVILLDRVSDPGNVGTIIRTAVACGYDVVLNNCADVYSPKVVRSAMSAVLKCRLAFDISPEAIKSAGYELIVSDMSGENVFASSAAARYCIVVGNEAHGVSEELLASADRTLCLPQENIESLNAAVAASVMMFALRFK